MAANADDLERLAAAFDDWAKKYPHIEVVYLFGSRVRGDRPDSDVDFAWKLSPSEGLDVKQWVDDFNALKARLPGPPVGPAQPDGPAWPAIVKGAASPVYTKGKVVCVLTAPKPSQLC